MLGSHPDCVCTPESHFKTSGLRVGRRADGTLDLEAAISFIKIHWRFKIWELDVDFAAAPRHSYVAFMDWLVAQYARVYDVPGSVWVDHTPENINYAPVLLDFFPNAKVVHLVRDGRAVAASIMPLDWGPNSALESAVWWKEIVRDGLTLEETFPGRIIRVRYEDVVRTPEETLPSLCMQLDLPYHPDVLVAKGFRAPGYTQNQHTLIGKRPDPSRIMRWKQRLTQRQIELVEGQAGDLLQELGYPLLFGPEARPPTSREKVAARWKELWRGSVVNTFRWFIRSYPLWLSPDFIRVLPDSMRAYKKADFPVPARPTSENSAELPAHPG